MKSNYYSTVEDKKIDSIFEMISSLNQSVIEAGGIPLKLDYLKEHSIYDLIKFLDPNNIRFIYKKHEN